MRYEDFVAGKMAHCAAVGLEDSEIRPGAFLFDFQQALVRWSLRRGRAAIFADTGLGKTAMQLDWARHVAERGRVLILTPLAVAKQTEREAVRFGVEGVQYAPEDNGARIWVTNYDRIDRVDPALFVGIVLDESSILKAFDGQTRTQLIESFASTPFRLACTATPAPNDYTELGNHSEFLGVKTRAEMLAEYFVHDMDTTQDWRVKGHAVESFWRWVCSWGAIVRKPADLGFEADGYDLPPLRLHEIVVPVDHTQAWSTGQLFTTSVNTLSEQRQVRRETMESRVSEIAKLASEPGQLLVWCELNDEASASAAAIEGAIEVKGSDDREDKEERLLGFADGKYRVLVSKPKIAGHGMNWQQCSRMVFAGASHSFEQTYQAIRRCWRFGQTKPVDVYVIRSEADDAVVANYKAKERRAIEMATTVVEYTREEVAKQLGKVAPRWDAYNPQTTMRIPQWLATSEV